MRLVFDDKKRVAQWVSARIERKIHKPYTAIGAERDGEIVAGAIFTGWNGANVDITLASDHGISPMTLKAVYQYAFHQLKAQRVTAHTRRNNKIMRQLLPRLGFVFEHTMPRFFGPERKDDAFVFSLFPDKARKFL